MRTREAVAGRPFCGQTAQTIEPTHANAGRVTLPTRGACLPDSAHAETAPLRKRQLALPLEPDQVRRADLTETDRALVAQAIRCLEQQYLVRQDCITSPSGTRDYLKLRLYGLPYSEPRSQPSAQPTGDACPQGGRPLQPLLGDCSCDLRAM